MQCGGLLRKLVVLLAGIAATLSFSDAQETAKMETVLLPSSSPLVSFRILFQIGSASDPQGKEGVAALTAAMISGGGTQKMSYSEIVQAMYPMATRFSSQVDKEMTVFMGSTHKDNLQKYFDLISSMLLEPGWKEEDFSRVKSDAINYLKVNLRGTNDEELAKEALYNFIYEDHPYGHENTGRVSTLEKLTLDDVKAFYKANYSSQNLVLGMAGDYGPEFLKQVKARFGSLPEGHRSSLVRPEPKAFDGLQVRIIKKEARATAISLGYPIQVTRRHKDWVALYLVQSYFGQHRSSNSYLYQRLRELRGLNYGDYAYIEYFPRGMFQFHPDPNLGRRQQIFQIWIRPVEPQNAHFALRTAIYELGKLSKEGMKQKDFEDTRRFLSKFVNVLTKTQDLQLGYQLDSHHYGIPGFNDYVKNGLAKLTLADVNRVIRENLQVENLVIVIAAKEAEKLKEALVANAASPVQYNAPKPAEILNEDKMLQSYRLKIPENAVKIIPVDQVFQ
jgi:zinc protease